MGFFIRFKKSTITNRIPANRNLKVAIAMGLKPSLSIAFTITNELPQKVIKRSSRAIFVKLMCFFSITTDLGIWNI